MAPSNSVRFMPTSDTALVVVDVQNDFCPGGALAVPDGDQVVPVINGWVGLFEAVGAPIVYSQDWHPQGHVSFQEREGPWPPHCVQGTAGASLVDGLTVVGPRVLKGFDLDVDAYSAFEGRVSSVEGSTDGPRLATWLRERGVRRLLVVGLATDYCVAATADDGLQAGFEITVDAAAARPVDVVPGDGTRRLNELESRGATILNR